MESDTSLEPTEQEPQQKERVSDEPVKPSASTTGSAESNRIEVSAVTVTRMMGIASSSDIKLLEGRVELLSAKVTSLLTKVERVMSMFSSVPSASDIDRLEIQIGTLKSLIREVLENVGGNPQTSDKGVTDRAVSQQQSKKLREGIRSSDDGNNKNEEES
jgi:hypothetical protein